MASNATRETGDILDAIVAQLQDLDYYSTFYNLTYPLAAELMAKK